MAASSRGRNSQLNSLDEGLRQLDQYLQKLKAIEAVAKNIAALLNGVGGKGDILSGLQQMQGLRFDTGGAVGGGGGGGIGGTPVGAGMPSAWVSPILQNALQNSAAGTTSFSGGGGGNPFNPFAGAAATGPVSSLGTPGYQMNTYLMQQQQQRQTWASTQTAMARGAIGLAASQVISGGLSLYARNAATGEMDPMGAAGLMGGAGGAVLGWFSGALLTPTAPGAGAATGAMLGWQTGSATAQAYMAPFMRTRTMAMTLSSIAAREGVNPYDLIQARQTTFDPKFRSKSVLRSADPEGLSGIAHSISMEGKSISDKLEIASGIYAGTDIISGPQLAETYATFGSALLSAGESPFDAMNPSVRMARKYGISAPGMAKMASGVMAARNRFGNNGADLALNFGAEAFGAYQDAIGGSDLSPRQLTSIRNIQRAEYRSSITSLQARGSGQATLDVVNKELLEIERLPGGKDSLAYATASAKARDLGRAAFDQSQTESFGIPYSKLQADRAVADLMPFGTGNRLSLQFANIRMLKGRVNSLEGYMSKRRAAGQLSEEEEQGLVDDIGRARVGIAGSVAALSEGRENVLPPMLAGATRFSGRFTSSSLAALALQRRGSPVRSYGAVNGQHLKEQDALFHQMGGEGFETPYSRTEALTSGRSSKEVVEAINNLTRVMERLLGGGSGGGRPGEATGAAAGVLARRSLGSSTIYQETN